MRTALAFASLLLVALAVALIAPDPAHAASLPDLAGGWDIRHVSTDTFALATAVPFSLFAPGRMLPMFEGDGGGGSGSPTPALTREEVQNMIKGQFGADMSPDMLNRLTDLTQRAAQAEVGVKSLQAQLDKAGNPEGAVVLTGDEATAYATLKAREGFDAAPLAKATETLDANVTALAEAATLKAQSVQDAAYRKAGLDPEKVRRYLPDLDARIEGEGDAAKVVAVTKTDGGGETTTPLDEVMQAEHAAILPALSLDATGATVAQRGGVAVGATLASRSAATPVKTGRLAALIAASNADPTAGKAKAA